MGQPEGMHLISERVEGHISSQVLESMATEKKAEPEGELSGKIRCFACYDTSHSLDQCSIKYKLVPVVHQFGYATKFPFIMIQPLEYMLEKEIFYHHCVLITSNVCNLDLDTVKVELQKIWKLSCAWVLRRECSKSFLASFSSHGDVARCLNNTSIEALLDDKEVKLTATRWTDDDESNHLIKLWFLVSGIPRKYRAWMELYQVASAFGVLIDVDEGSLEVGDKEPIRLKIALRNQSGAPFSYHYVVGWSSRMVMLTVEATIDSETNSHSTRILTSTSTHVLDFGHSSDEEHRKEQNAAQSLLLDEPTCIEESRLDGKTKENQISTPADKVHTSKKTTIESSKAEETQSVRRNSTAITVEDCFEGIIKPPIKYVYKRRGKKQQDTDDKAINKTPSNKLGKVIGPESNNATRIGASEVERKRELNKEEIALTGVSKKSEEVGACREKEKKGASLAASTINSEKKIVEDSSKTDIEKFKNSTTLNGEDLLKGIPKPPVKPVLAKGMGPESSKAKRIGALMGVSKTSEEVGACRGEGENSVTVATTPINSMEKKISEESSKTHRAQFKNSTTIMIGEDHLKGIPKPPVIHVFKRRGKKQKDIEAINKSPSKC